MPSQWIPFLCENGPGYEANYFEISVGKSDSCTWTGVLCIVGSGIITIILAFLVAKYLSPTYSTLPLSLPHLTPNFVGREREIAELCTFLEYTAYAPRIVNIAGGPGFGKSTLAIYMGHELLREGVDVIYININEMNSMYTFYYIELKIGQILGRKIKNMFELSQWSSSLNHKTLLILDNWDQFMYAKKGDLQEVVTKLTEQQSTYSNFKILITSREQTTYIDKKQEMFLIHELTVPDACQLLRGISKQPVSDQNCKEITDIAGSVPLALQAIGGLLNMPTLTIEKIVLQLKENLIGTLSSKILPEKLRISDSFDQSYEYLGSAVTSSSHSPMVGYINIMQQIARLLSDLPGSFTEADAASIIGPTNNNIVSETLQVLITRSLLDYNQETDCYVYHKLIRAYFKCSRAAFSLDKIKEAVRNS